MCEPHTADHWEGWDSTRKREETKGMQKDLLAGKASYWRGREKPSKNFVKLYVGDWDMKTKMLLIRRCGKCQAVISGAHRGLWHCGFIDAVLVIISI